MSNNISWEDLVDSEKNNPKKTPNQGTDKSDSLHDEIREMIQFIPPDIESHITHLIGAFIYQKLDKDGFAIFDGWYKTSSNYLGTEDARAEFNSDSEIKSTIDKETILQLSIKYGNTATQHTPGKPISPSIFEDFSLTGKSDTLKSQLTDEIDVLNQLATLGKLHYFFGAPNTGKTLLIISLLLQSIHAKRIKASNVFYFNLDDALNDLVTKVEIFEELGVHVIADGQEGFNASNFIQLLNKIIDDDQAHGVIIVLDTLKKFVDVMNKSHVREWNKILRRFTGKGGTIIALAHVNKHANKSGKSIYAGVADLVDDCDISFVINKVSTDDKTQIATVEFENIKRRGNVASQVAFSYSVDPKISYEERLASVELVDQERLHKIKIAESINSDKELIEVTTTCITEGINTKMRLRNAISERTGISHRKALQLIEKYVGANIDKHKWCYTVHEHNKHVYQLLTGAYDEK